MRRLESDEPTTIDATQPRGVDARPDPFGRAELVRRRQDRDPAAAMQEYLELAAGEGEAKKCAR
jgi:hypothetical protein